MSYIVMIPNGGKPYWLAPWAGDPGRTFLKENARVYLTRAGAEQAIRRVQKLWAIERPSLLEAKIIRASAPESNA